MPRLYHAFLPHIWHGLLTIIPHHSWSRFETKLHGFGGIVRGGFWHDFGQDFGVNFEKEIAYLFRHPRVRAHV